jgi:hypothetical protein
MAQRERQRVPQVTQPRPLTWPLMPIQPQLTQSKRQQILTQKSLGSGDSFPSPLKRYPLTNTSREMGFAIPSLSPDSHIGEIELYYLIRCCIVGIGQMKLK